VTPSFVPTGPEGRSDAGVMLRRWWAWTGPPVATGVLIVAAVVALDWMLPPTSGPNRPLRVLLEGLQGAVGGLAALLMYGRLRSTGRRSDAALVASLGLAAATNLGMAVGFASLPVDGTSVDVDAALDWAAVTLRMVAALYLLAAAVGPPRRRIRRIDPRLSVIAAVLVPAVVTLIAVFSARSHLPVAVVVGGDGDPLGFESHALIAAAQIVLILLTATSAAAFLVRSARFDDRFLLWIGLATGLGTVARIEFWLQPTIYSDTVRVGDALRFADYLVLLAAAVVEIRSYWAAEAVVLAQHERQRLARTLHDGLVQELSFLRAWASSVAAGRSHPELAGDVAAAVERAHVESRQLLDLLAAPPLSLGSPSTGDDPLTSLRTEVETLAARAGVEAEVRWPPGQRFDQQEAAVLGAIAREAVINALRHGRPEQVVVELWPDSRCALRVVDDGQGSEDAAPGFGRRAMADLAAELEADLWTGAGPDSTGTMVEVRRR